MTQPNAERDLSRLKHDLSVRLVNISRQLDELLTEVDALREVLDADTRQTAGAGRPEGV